MTDQLSMSLQRPGGKDAIEHDARIHKTPVTKAELEARIDSRAKPVVERHLQPGGIVEEVVRQRLDAENERRINFLEKRLNRMQGTARARFNMAR